MTLQEYKAKWYMENKERIQAKRKAEFVSKRVQHTYEELHERRVATWRKHNQLPIAKFRFQRNRAENRGVQWNLTFEEWWYIWQSSGRWEERGIRKDNYCMCRYGDVGPYSIDNVYIDKVSENAARRPKQKEIE